MHRWSDHPEVKALVTRIWDKEYLLDEITGGLAEGKLRPGPKPKASFRKHLLLS